MPDTNKMAAREGAAEESTVDTSSFDYSVSETDKLTVLETVGPCLTKIYKSDGTTDPYDDAASFHYKVVEVSDIHGLSRLLGKLHKNKKRCLIAGAPKGEGMEAGNVEGSVTRTNANFTDQPLHSFVIDIDGYRPGFADPITDTEQAVLDFFTDNLSPAFQDCSFYWHLSSSAGMPGKVGVLKCHVWLWSKTPYTCAQLTEWAKSIGPAVDRAVYRRVQIRYTADPIFEAGRIDPVPVRCGFHQGKTDYVDLVIDQATLDKARDQGSGEGGSDMVLKDPSEKEGLIGAFHKAFTAEDVLLHHLEGFEQVTERRYTWHDGGGTPEGVWVHDDGQHIGSSHNTWPIDGIANLWDVVRVFKFGDLDHREGEEEDFETLGEFQVGSRPSDLAMKAWAAQLPELKEILEAEALEQINAQSDFAEEGSATADDQEADAEPSESSKSLKTLTMTQLMAMPQPKWLVKNLLARDSLALVYGQSSVGKTFVVIDIALAVARATGEWFGRKAKSGGVFYIAGEGARGLVNRMKAYCQHHGVDPEEVQASFYAGALNLLDENAAEIAMETVRLLKPSLVIIDTLATTMIGGDESSAKDMTSYLASAKMLRRASKACVLIVHHSGKDESRGARGSSSLRAAVDTEIAITQNGDVRIMKITKQRDGIAGVEFGYQLQAVDLGMDEDLESITSCVVTPADVPGQPAKPLGAVQSQIMDAIGFDMTITKERLYDVVIPLLPLTQGKPDRRRERVNQALKSLESSGHIEINAEGVITASF